jgi:AcrR family transcriptional regulator
MAATTLSDGPIAIDLQPGPTLEARVLEAAVRCVGRWGVAKTTLDDVAREAGCSRASVYRVFPGGKDVLVRAAADREIAAVLGELATVLDSHDTLADAVTAALCLAVDRARSHPALQYLVEHEPGTVLPFVSFDGLDPLLELATAFGAPRLRRFLPDATAAELAELLARLVVSHAFDPSPYVDLADPDQARRYVTAFVLPGLAAEPAA